MYQYGLCYTNEYLVLKPIQYLTLLLQSQVMACLHFILTHAFLLTKARACMFALCEAQFRGHFWHREASPHFAPSCGTILDDKCLWSVFFHLSSCMLRREQLSQACSLAVGPISVLHCASQISALPLIPTICLAPFDLHIISVF